MDFEAIGKRIRKVRRSADLTQEQLAEIVGISTSFIGHIERGSRIPSIQTLYSICLSLNCSLDFIVGLN